MSDSFRISGINFLFRTVSESRASGDTLRSRSVDQDSDDIPTAGTELDDDGTDGGSRSSSPKVGQ